MKKPLVASVAALVVLGAGVGGVYAYDTSRADTIQAGVRVAGIDVGGMTPREARAALRRRVVSPLERPLLITSRRRGWMLTPSDAELRVDVNAMVEDALAQSRAGNFLSRSLRALRGQAIDVRVPLRATFSHGAVEKLASAVGQTLFRAPREAKATVSVDGATLLPSRQGVAVRERELRRMIASRLVSPQAPRRVRVPVKTLAPRVTTKELRSKYRYLITVSRPTFELRLFVGLRLAKTYRISVGQVGYDTPSGLYRIRNKAVNPSWWVPNEAWAGELAGRVVPPGPDNPIKARWMGIYNGAGIHGTDAVDSIGQRASHGCIRMMVPDVVDLYDRVPVGTPVYIA
ncbi:MAG: L,D-transpeptidase/peptidoglycan binding protein [Actinomycetota bacterium]|nr:L,D-transpeptidase/peptidoglycan binding protein [Actinomycetota bacterium]